MGRRKIEIQPIQHERNRSVTFLKRKNGLFKKAYELGVLCSVDVAVIIFEERPGHHLKLYQYCSGDIQDIVERQRRFDGEKDTKGPPDFSGTVATKVEEGEGGDDDEGEDEDDAPRTKRSRGGSSSSRLKLPGDATEDYMTHRTVGMPQPPMGLQSGAPSLPLSTLRSSSGSSSTYGKRTRRSPSDDTAHPASGSTYSYPGAPQPSSTSNFPRGNYGMHMPSSSAPVNPNNGGGGGGTPGAGPGGYFYNTNTPPQQPFMSLGSDFPSRQPGTRGGFPRNAAQFDQAGTGGGGYGSAPMLRPQQSPGAPSHVGGGANDMFSFLDSDQRGAPGQQPSHSSFGLEWPVQSGNAGTPSGSGSGGQQGSGGGAGGASSSSTSAGGADWIDFLSQSRGENPAASRGAPPNTSWERGGPPGQGGSNDRTSAHNSNNNSSNADLAELFAGPGEGHRVEGGPRSAAHLRSPRQGNMNVYGSGGGGGGLGGGGGGGRRVRDVVDDGPGMPGVSRAGVGRAGGSGGAMVDTG